MKSIQLFERLANGFFPDENDIHAVYCRLMLHCASLRAIVETRTGERCEEPEFNKEHFLERIPSFVAHATDLESKLILAGKSVPQFDPAPLRFMDDPERVAVSPVPASASASVAPRNAAAKSPVVKAPIVQTAYTGTTAAILSAKGVDSIEALDAPRNAVPIRPAGMTLTEFAAQETKKRRAGK